jgi:hypothetical protein
MANWGLSVAEANAVAAAVPMKARRLMVVIVPLGIFC